MGLLRHGAPFLQGSLDLETNFRQSIKTNAQGEGAKAGVTLGHSWVYGFCREAVMRTMSVAES